MSTLVKFDWAMKKLLRSKANFGILEGFLSELLKKDLKILQLLESESNKENAFDKQNRVDMLVQLQDGEVVLIEVQVETQYNYFHRMIFSTSKIITEYLNEGNKYSDIKKVYSINILYFDLGEGKDYIYHGRTRFMGLHEKDELVLNDKQQELYKKQFVHEIYPEYYLIKVNNFNELAKDTLDEWIYFLKTENIEYGFKAKGLLEAKKKLDRMKLSPEDKRQYEIYIDNLRQESSMVESSYDVGVLDGKKAGIEMGMEMGMAERTRAIVKRMKEAGLSCAKIKTVTDLSDDEINAL